MVVYRSSLGGKIFDAINITFLMLFALVTILPFVNVIAGSFSAPEHVSARDFVLIPQAFTLEAYIYVFSTNALSRSLLVSVYITIAGTLTQLIITGLLAFALAHKSFVGRRVVMFLIILTFLFDPGIIPRYLVVRWLGLMNNIWAMILPRAVSAFFLIIWKNFFQNLPYELEEAAKLDGAKEIRILFSIFIPLSLPAVATFTLFYSVGNWNEFLSAMLFINDSRKWPIQVMLRQVVILSQSGIGDFDSLGRGFTIPPVQSIQMAVITVATVPILIVYPFLQKHFVKGALIGSIKG